MELALRDGADVVITDVVPAAVERIVDAHPSVRVVDDADALVRFRSTSTPRARSAVR